MLLPLEQQLFTELIQRFSDASLGQGLASQRLMQLPELSCACIRVFEASLVYMKRT